MEFLTRLFQVILTFGAMSCVIVPLLLLVKKVFHHVLSPKWQYYLWAILLLRLLLPIQPPSPVSIYNVFYSAAKMVSLPVSYVIGPQNEVTSSPIAENAPDIIDIPAAGDAVSPDLDDGSASGQTAQNGASDRNGDLGAGTLMRASALIWLIGATALGGYTVALNLAFAARVRRQYRPLQNDRITYVLALCKRNLHIRRDIPLLTTDTARTPCLYGFFKPKILINEACMTSLSDTEIKHIFLHELSHYRRKDIAVNSLMTLLQIAYFFNPLIWYAFYKIRQECEIACDAAALSRLTPEEYGDYGGTVLKLMRLLSESSFIPVTAGLSKNKTSIKRRIHMIGNFKKSKWTGALLALVLMAAIALVGLTGCNTQPSTPPTDNTPSAQSSADPVQSPSDEPTGSDTDPSTSPMPTTAPSPTAAPSPGAPEPTPTAAPTASASVYLGEWTVSGVQAYGPVGTYSKEDAEKLVGQTLRFTAEEAAFINDQPTDSPVTVKNPGYEERTVTKEAFFTDFRVSFDTLGIAADSLTMVEVSASGTGGCILLVKNADTLLLAAGGTYFLLTRV